NKAPRTLPYGSDKKTITNFLIDSQLIQVPLVNKKGQVLGVETLEHLVAPARHEAAVFLMAGGFGTRLHPLTHETPKPLLKIGQSPVMQNILESFIANGFHKFYIAVHYKSDMIQDYFGNGSKWGVEIEYIVEEEPLGTAGALGYLAEQSKPLLVMNCDLLTKVDFSALLRFHLENDAMATMGVREYDFQLPYGMVQSKESRVTGLIEKPVYSFFVNAGFYVLSPEILKFISTGKFLNMTDVLNQALKRQEKVVMFPIHEYWLDIGRLDDFEQAKKDIVNYFQEVV
nr:nucleotidyltransferase family protein [Gammaproteobacteria bacterium]